MNESHADSGRRPIGLGKFLAIGAVVLSIFMALIGFTENHMEKVRIAEEAARKKAEIAAQLTKREEEKKKDAEELRERCTSGLQALIAQARPLLRENPSEAVQALKPCQTVATDPAANAFLRQAYDAVYASNQKREKDAERAQAKERSEERALRKQHGVSIGMSEQEVLDSSWGRPQRINRTSTAAGSREQWVYGIGNYLYFDNGKLTAVQSSR